MYSQIYKKLNELERQGQAIKVAAVGTGFIGRGMIIQASFMKGVRISLIYGRDLDKVRHIVKQCNHNLEYQECTSTAELKAAQNSNKIALVSDPNLIYESDADIVVDTTGAPEFGARVAYNSILSGKHIVTNPEMDICIGPELKQMAQEHNVIYSGQDGDEPGVVKQLFDYVSILGFEITALGKFKNFTDIHATPTSVKPWSDAYKQNPYKISSFADGTKMNIEMGLVSNATGYLPDVRGMHGHKMSIDEIVNHIKPKEEGGILHKNKVIEIIPGAEPSGGVFVIGHSNHPQVIDDMQYYKMGTGPYYLFYRPYHLCSIEILVGAVNMVLNRESTIEPIAERPLVDVATFAKRPLKKGERLDCIGGYDYYGLVDNYLTYRNENALSVSLAENAIVTRDIAQDEILTMNDIEIENDNFLWEIAQKRYEK